MKKKYWWIGASLHNHLKDLKVHSGYANIKDLDEFIYFENEADAKAFLKNMQKFILDNYKN